VCCSKNLARGRAEIASCNGHRQEYDAKTLSFSHSGYRKRTNEFIHAMGLTPNDTLGSTRCLTLSRGRGNSQATARGDNTFNLGKLLRLRHMKLRRRVGDRGALRIFDSVG